MTRAKSAWVELNHLPTVYKTATLTDELQADDNTVDLGSDWLSVAHRPTSAPPGIRTHNVSYVLVYKTSAINRYATGA